MAVSQHPSAATPERHSRHRARRSRPLLAVAGVAAAALALVGCSTGGTEPADGQISVLAAFYPLQFAAERVGGESVSVDSLTPPGAEPHDVELSPQQVAAVAEADLIVYIAGFQPAVDDAVAGAPADRVLEVSADLELLEGGGGHADEGGDHADEGGDHADEAGTDPHVWLDPTNMMAISDAIAERLTAIDSAAAEQFSANAAALDADLEALDGEWKEGTRECTSRDLVVSHEAFAYLADRYGFTQVGISGLSPEAEPNPAQVARIADFVERNDVRTIYSETLVDPKVAQTVADETGALTAVLDPLEGLAEGSTEDYLSVMRTNLQTVRDGQPCT